jgi:hypothetical protein
VSWSTVRPSIAGCLGIELMHMLRKRQLAGGVEQGLTAAEQFYFLAASSPAWQGSLRHCSKFATQPLQVVECVEMDLDAAVASNGHDTARKRLKAVAEVQTSIANNQGFIPNYGERYHAGERISTGFVESTVNHVVSKRFCKQQQMAWTPRGAHLLLQIRTRVLNGDWEATFQEWYPGFRSPPQQVAA